MKDVHLEILVEEASMEVFLRALLPRLLGDGARFDVHAYQGKDDLVKKLPDRLRGYTHWIPETWRIVVVVDRDQDDCYTLKQRMEAIITDANLRSRAKAKSMQWQVVSRIAIEELEAWYFGDWETVCALYPGVSENIPKKKNYRDPDAIPGGTWESFERILQKAGHHKGGLRKIEAARALGGKMVPDRNRSRSFQVFRAALLEAIA